MSVVYKGRDFSVEVSTVTLPNEREVTVEVIRHPRSVVLIPIPQPGHVILIRQYRFAVNQWLWELPADLQRVLDELRERFNPLLHET